MAILFHDDCSSLDNWTVYIDNAGAITSDGDCIHPVQEFNGDYYEASQSILRGCLVGLEDFEMEAQIKKGSASETFETTGIMLFNDTIDNYIGFNTEVYNGVATGYLLYTGDMYSFSLPSTLFNATKTYKLCRTGNKLELYVDNTLIADYENTAVGAVDITKIYFGFTKDTAADESALKSPALYDIKVSSVYQFAHGSGTEQDPYQVWTAEDLNGVRDYLDAYFIQMADIDLSGFTNWVPIGDATGSGHFSGFYDGNNFIVSNLTMIYSSFRAIGLFGSILDGSVSNLGIENININSSGTIVGAGGLAGAFHSDNRSLYKISNCYCKGTVIAENNAGLLIGIVTGFVINCWSEGTVRGIIYKYVNAGGLVGKIISGEIHKCYSLANVEGVEVGGLIGSVLPGVAIENCYAMGNVTGTRFAGGLIGNSYSPYLANCYSKGFVSLTPLVINNIGGLIGMNDSSIIVTPCYYDSDVSGQSDTGKGEPKTTAEMKQQSTYENWDFDTIWDIDGVTNDGYPFLRGQKPSDGYNLTITVEGNGTTSPQAGTSQHEAGKNVLLIAYPEPGHKLLRWEGYGVEDTESEYTQIKMTANRSVKAVFAEEAILKLVAAGGGTTNPPPGEISYAKGQVVTLKAAPHRGFKFKEWTKDISSTNDVYELLMDGDKTVWAIFDDDEDDKSTKRKLYFATAREKAFWMINGKWRFFATPVHSNLKKLEADDHKQYLNNERHDKISRHRLGDTVPHDSHENLNNVGFYSHKKIDEHIESMENPHLVTATQVGAIPYLYGDTLPEAGEEYRGFFFTLPGEAGPPEVEDKLYYCRSVDGGTTYEWKEIIFV